METLIHRYKMKKLQINGYPVFAGDFNSWSDLIMILTETENRKILIHLNHYNYYILTNEKQKLDGISTQSVLIHDGIGMKIGTFLTGKGWLDDINGTDLYPLLMDKFCKRHKRIFMLGCQENVVKTAIQNTKQVLPKIEIVGCHSGYFEEAEEGEIVQSINNSKPDVLIISMGMQKEIEFLHRNSAKLNPQLIWNVGGLFEFVSGKRRRAPQWIRKIRLEWLFRFFIEPRKMFFRIFILPFWFYYSLFSAHLKSKNA